MGDRRRPALPSAPMTRQIEQDAKPGSGEAGGEPRPPQIAIRAASRLGAAGGHRRAHHPRCLQVKQRLLETTARSEEHTSELQSLMRISYAVFCLKKKKHKYMKHKTQLLVVLPKHYNDRRM